MRNFAPRWAGDAGRRDPNALPDPTTRVVDVESTSNTHGCRVLAIA
jgi:hypothetical protein